MKMCTQHWGWYENGILFKWHYPEAIICLRHDDVMEHFPRNWPFVRGIHQSPVNSPHKGQWRGALMISLICVWTNCWVNTGDAGDFRGHRAHYDITVMSIISAYNFGSANDVFCRKCDSYLANDCLSPKQRCTSQNCRCLLLLWRCLLMRTLSAL